MRIAWRRAMSCSAKPLPKYGVLVPVLLAIYERHFGLIALGDHMRLLVGIEIVYWIIVGYLFLIWSRGRWLCCLLPVVLLLEFFWSAVEWACSAQSQSVPHRRSDDGRVCRWFCGMHPAQEPVGGRNRGGAFCPGERRIRESRRRRGWSFTSARRYALDDRERHRADC